MIFFFIHEINQTNDKYKPNIMQQVIYLPSSNCYLSQLLRENFTINKQTNKFPENLTFGTNLVISPGF